MVESRDQVRRTSLRPPEFIAMTRFINLASTKGPFFSDLLICCLSRAIAGAPPWSVSLRGSKGLRPFEIPARQRHHSCASRAIAGAPPRSVSLRGSKGLRPFEIPTRQRHHSCALPNDEFIGGLAAACLFAHGHLAPFGLRLTADWGFAFATPMRMVARIHRRAAHGWPETHV